MLIHPRTASAVRCRFAAVSFIHLKEPVMARVTVLELQQRLAAAQQESQALRVQLSTAEGALSLKTERVAALESELRATAAEADMFGRNALNFEVGLNEAERREAELALIVESLADLDKDTWTNTEHAEFCSLARSMRPAVRVRRTFTPRPATPEQLAFREACAKAKALAKSTGKCVRIGE